MPNSNPENTGEATPNINPGFPGSLTVRQVREETDAPLNRVRAVRAFSVALESVRDTVSVFINRELSLGDGTVADSAKRTAAGLAVVVEAIGGGFAKRIRAIDNQLLGHARTLRRETLESRRANRRRQG